jgi:hypothetical protein
MRVILLMDESISSATPPEALLANPRLGLHLRRGPEVNGPFLGQGALLQSAPASIVSFLVEGFAVAQPPGTAHIFKKSFPEGQPPIALRLPITLPVTFTTSGDSVVLGYFDTPRISAADTKNHVTQILNNLWGIPVLLVRIKGVDPKLFLPGLLAFADAAQLVVMYDIESENEREGNADLIARILKSHWDDRLDDKVHRELQRLFDDSAVVMCSTCGCLFARGDGSPCKPPGRAHVAGRPGRQAPSIAFAVTSTMEK